MPARVHGRVLHDAFFRDAKRVGYLARSAFKLLEIQDRFRVVPRGARVLDLGCHPGSWLQVASQSVGPGAGAVVGVDLKETPVPAKFCAENVRTIQVGHGW